MACRNPVRCVTLALIFILGLWTNQATCRSLQDASMYERYGQWMAQYGRVYKDSIEKQTRYKIFKQNVERIEAFNNAANQPYKLGINKFADITNEEFKASRNRFKGHMCSSTTKTTTFKYENVTVVPPSLDWRLKGAVTPIKVSQLKFN